MEHSVFMVKRAKKPAPKRKLTLDDMHEREVPTLHPDDEAELRALGQQFAAWRAPGNPGGGRPRKPDREIKGARYGLRLHADLRRELDHLANADGLLLSVWIQHLLVRAVNDRYSHAVLDKFGRYLRDERTRQR